MQRLWTPTSRQSVYGKHSDGTKFAILPQSQFSQVLNEARPFLQHTLTFLIVLQKEVEVAELTEHIRVNFPLALQDECIVAANGLWKRKGKKSKKTKQ